MSKFLTFLGLGSEPAASAVLPDPVATVIPAVVTAPANPSAELENALASACAERDAARAELTSAQDIQARQAAELVTVLAQLEALAAEKAAILTERDTFKAAAERTEGEVRGEVRNRELADLAASQGVPAAQVPGVAAETAEDTMESVQAEIAACTDPVAYAKLCARARALVFPPKARKSA